MTNGSPTRFRVTLDNLMAPQGGPTALRKLISSAVDPMGFLGGRFYVIYVVAAAEVLLSRLFHVPAPVEDAISKRFQKFSSAGKRANTTCQHAADGFLSEEALLYGELELHASARLLPPLMDLWRRNLSNVLHHTRGQSGAFFGNCSCRNPEAVRSCCERTIRQTHKMGYSMTKKTFKGYRPSDVLSLNTRARVSLDDVPVDVDYRDVIFIRNIYASIRSGYLYHASGRECWLNSENHPFAWKDARRVYPKSVVNWTTHLRTTRSAIPDELTNETLCHYLARANEADGMRVYIDWVFHAFYDNLDHWAMAHSIQEVRERTLHVCYEDFLSPDKNKKVIEGLLSFLFNDTSVEWPAKPLSGHRNYAGGHSTHADREQSQRLLQIIHDHDRDHFNGEIAWLQSVLPC